MSEGRTFPQKCKDDDLSEDEISDMILGNIDNADRVRLVDLLHDNRQKKLIKETRRLVYATWAVALGTIIIQFFS